MGTLLPMRLVAIFVVGMVGIFASFACVTGRMNSLRFELLAKAIVSRRSSPINLTKRSYDIVVDVQTKSKQTKHDNVVNVYKQ